jgi:hypothetical protein
MSNARIAAGWLERAGEAARPLAVGPLMARLPGQGGAGKRKQGSFGRAGWGRPKARIKGDASPGRVASSSIHLVHPACRLPVVEPVHR